MDILPKSIKQREQGNEIITQRMLYAAGLGLIPIPIVDAAGIFTNQLLMVRDIAKIYEVSFEGQNAKALIGTLVGNVGTVGLVKAIPGIGSALGGAAVSVSGAAATYAIGKVFLQHFNHGGTLLDFDPEKSRRYFKEKFEEGKAEIGYLKNSSDYQSKGNGEISKKQIKKRRDLVEDSHPRKSQNGDKRRKIFWFLGLIGLALLIFMFWNYPSYTSKSSVETPALGKLEIKQITLTPVENFDTTLENRITDFISHSTESEIAKYIQSSGTTYPKRFALSAVRYNNQSNLISEGATEQIANIAILMKKYPALEVHFFGQTYNTGPYFYRRKVGRDRARVLVEIIEADPDIDNFRVTANFVERPLGVFKEYWGAEVLIDASTIESEVLVK